MRNAFSIMYRTICPWTMVSCFSVYILLFDLPCCLYRGHLARSCYPSWLELANGYLSCRRRCGASDIHVRHARRTMTKPGTSVSSCRASCCRSQLCPRPRPRPALVVPTATFSPMAGLISPKPVSYMQHTLPQYNSYQRGVQGYPDLQANPLPPLSHPTPHQGVFLPGSTPNPTLSVNEESKIYALVIDLLSAEARESALLELSKKREQYDDLALVLWHSFGVYLRTC